jgi:hypothetical protein
MISSSEGLESFTGDFAGSWLVVQFESVVEP